MLHISDRESFFSFFNSIVDNGDGKVYSLIFSSADQDKEI